jgi:hypothetical protein
MPVALFPKKEFVGPFAERIAKIEGFLGKETAQELAALSSLDLKNRLTQARKSIRDAKDELEANPAYQDAKENVKALSSGYREVKKRQDAVTEYCLYLLEEQGA